jgi:Xaa-Pro aminopeptidase
MLADHGPTYAHHTGHRIGAAWSEEPRITPYCEERIEEGMVLALEPAIYLPNWGGIRLEHTFLVGPRENEILTMFEHTL